MKSLLLHELNLAFRARGRFALPLVFYLAVALLIPFGIGPDTETIGRSSIGILWAGALLANLLPLQHLFQEDMDDGTIERLTVSPLPLEFFALGKIIANWLATGLPICLVAPFVGSMLNVPSGTGPAILLTLLAGTPALSSIGAFGAALTVGAGRSGILAAVIVVPFCIPTLIFGSSATNSLAAGTDALAPLTVVLAISLACVALIPIASAKVLRINLR